MIHELIITWRAEDQYFNIERASATGVTNGVLLHTMLEGAILQASMSNEIPYGDEVSKITDCQVLHIKYNPEGEGRKLVIEQLGVEVTPAQAMGIFSYAKVAAEKMAERNRMRTMLKEELKQILGPDGRPMNRG